MNLFVGSLSENYFVNPNGLAFDFTNKSDITFIEFVGANNTLYSVKKKLDFYKKFLFSKLAKHINVVIVGDNKLNGKLYTCNYSGVLGTCNSVWELGNILYNKIYIENNTKKTVVFGDCGGSLPAILTSTIVPYHSINFTTPYYQVIGGNHDFDTSQYSIWFAREICVHVHNTENSYKQYFDTLDFYEQYTRNQSNYLNLHWANTVVGTDLLFRDKAKLLPKRSNFKIIDHLVPSTVEGHLLASYLVKTKKWYQMIIEEIKIQQSIIDTFNKNSVAG